MIFYDRDRDEFLYNGQRYGRVDDTVTDRSFTDFLNDLGDDDCTCGACTQRRGDTPLRAIENAIWDLLKVVIDAQK